MRQTGRSTLASTLRPWAAVLVTLMSGCQCGARLVGSSSRFTVAPSSVNFGDVGAGRTERRALVGTVVGRSDVRITAVTIEQGAGEPFATTLQPQQVGATESVQFFVSYTAPPSASADVGVLVLQLDGEELRVPLSARVTAGCTPRTTCEAVEGATPECGEASDGCGGLVSCGACAGGQQCVSQRCVSDAGTMPDAGTSPDAGTTPDAGSCLARTCAAAGAACGAVSDGCGGTLDCGTCGAGQQCQQNTCACMPSAEQCGDGVDNDCDGTTDCADTDCASAAQCAQPPCTNTAPEVQVTASPANASTAFIASIGGGAWGVFTHESFGNSNLRYSYQQLGTQLQLVGAPAPMSGMLAAHKPFAAWTGTEFGLGWSDFRGQTNDVSFARMTTAGQRVLPADVPVTTGPGIDFPAAIGWNAGAQEFAVIWGDGRAPGQTFDRALYFRRIDAQGQLVGPDVSLTPSPAGIATDYSDLVWGGANWGVVTTQVRGTAPAMVFLRLSSTGAPELAETQLNMAGQGGIEPRITHSPSHYGVVFMEARGPTYLQGDIIFTRLAKSGPANPLRVAVTTSGTAGSPAVVWTGAGWIAFYADRRTGVSRIWATRLDPSGARVGNDELISCGSGDALFPHATFDGTRVAVVWTSKVGGVSQAFAKAFVP